MQAHNLTSNSRKSKRRVARGGQKGTYSGRGMKGQCSRSGFSQRPTFEGGRSSLVSQAKKVRGFKSKRAANQVVAVELIEKKYADGEVVSPETLKAKGLISKTYLPVKILGGGKLTKKVKFEDVATSKAVAKSSK